MPQTIRVQFKTAPTEKLRLQQTSCRATLVQQKSLLLLEMLGKQELASCPNNLMGGMIIQGECLSRCQRQCLADILVFKE